MPRGSAVTSMTVWQTLKSVNGGYHKTAGLHGAEHGVRVLPKDPLVPDESPKTGEFDASVRIELVGGRILHPGIGGDDEISGEPRTEPHEKAGPPVADPAEILFTEQK